MQIDRADTIKTIKDLRESYNRIYRAEPIGASKRHYRWVVDLLDWPQRGKLLDIACGAGHFMAEASDRSLCFGLDLADEAVNLARKNCCSGMFAIASGEALPWKSESFDMVTNLGSLEHFLSPEKGIQEIARVLRADGKACLLLPNSKYVWDLARSAIGRRRRSGSTQELSRSGNLEEWKNLLVLNGLEISRIVKCNNFPDKYNLRGLFLRFTNWMIPLAWGYHFAFICRRRREEITVHSDIDNRLICE
jgi:SAM-dependent methyltransferase